MTLYGPILLYLLSVGYCGLLAAPMVRSAFAKSESIPLMSLSLTVGFPITLVVFSLLTQLNASYEVSLPSTLVLLSVAAWLLWRQQQNPLHNISLPKWDRATDRTLLIAFAIVLTLAVFVRSMWPAVTWDNSVEWVGVEKLFNLSMIQAFTFGQGFPPENLWLAGQPVDYYLLCHALPGLVSWAWRIVSGESAAAGVLFVFSDAFLFAFAGLAVAAWTVALLGHSQRGLQKQRILAIAAVAAATSLLATHAKAVGQVVQALAGFGHPSWMDLYKEVIPFTHSHYPVMTLLLGDHHAFQRIAFLQVAFFGALAMVLLARKTAPAAAILAGLLAAAVALWHTGSVLLGLAVLVPVFLALGLRHVLSKEWRGLAVLTSNAAITAGVALLAVLPSLLSRQGHEVRWYWVEPGLASPLWEFVLAQSGPLLLLAAGCVAAVVVSHARSELPSIESTARSANYLLRVLLPAACLLLVLSFAGYGGVGVATVCVWLILTHPCEPATSGAKDRWPLTLLAAAGFAIWLLPEFVVVDLANRPALEWKRWQMTMRFWLEGYTLIPFFVAVALGPVFAQAMDRPAFRRGSLLVATGVVLSWLCVHLYTIVDRVQLSPDQPGLDGFAFLQRNHRCDAAIIDHLRTLPGRVQVGELCGTGETRPDIPVNYAWPGRIAAYSARPGVCGWSWHVWESSQRVDESAYRGPWSWVRFRDYERTLVSLLQAVVDGRPVALARQELEKFGVTHIVVGEHEMRLFPGLSIDRLAQAFASNASLSSPGGCGVLDMQSDLHR